MKAYKGGRTERIYLRVTPQEKTELLALAQVDGLSFSDWLVKTHLTPPAPDAWESAPKKAVSKPKVLSTSQTLSTPTKRR